MGLYTNTTNSWQYPNGVAVAPGVTRDIPGYITSNKPKRQSHVPEVAPYPELVGNVKIVSTAINAVTSISRLNELRGAEEAEEGRKTVIAAIDARILELSAEVSAEEHTEDSAELNAEDND